MIVVLVTISSRVVAAPGDLDTSFNGTGVVTTSLGNGIDMNNGVAIQMDGRIVVAGQSYNGTNFDFAVARYNPDGTLDTSFSTDGLLTTDLNTNSWDIALDVAIQTDGKIVVVGESRAQGTTSFALARYNPDGSLDTSFNGTGKVLTTTFRPAYSVVLQPDGKIVLAGDGFTIARYLSNGSLDTSFDGDGIVTTMLEGLFYGAHDVALQADGRIVAAGYIKTGQDDAVFAIVRYNTDGSLDTSFDNDGKVTTDFGAFYDAVQGVAIQSDGKIVAAGHTASSNAGGTVITLVRYLTNGSLDPAFDGDGKVTTPFGLSSVALAVTIQSNQKIVAAGVTYDKSTAASAIVRYNPDASLDTSFGVGGKVSTQVGAGSLFTAVAIQRDGRIVAGGPTLIEVNDDFSVVRYLGDVTVPRRSPFDFDGDSKTDVGIFRPTVGEWWINRSSDSQTLAVQFGASTDSIAPADYTGDGKTDVAFFRPASGEWYVLRSEDFSFFALPFGTNGDVPVPADFDADGKADFAVFRPSSSTWFITQSSGAPTRIEQFGTTGDVPVVADYDGDGKADVGIFRPAVSGAEWWIIRSTAGLLATQFGASTDKAVQGDYTGDGKADVAIWRPSNGNWLILRSEDFSFYGFPFGASGDVVSPGDYDGDGKFDAAVFRPSNATWFIERSTAGTQIVQFGAPGDRPIPNAFVP